MIPRVIAALLIMAMSTSCHGLRSSDEAGPRVVDRFDLDRYLGKWYEIARMPNSFQRGCVAATAIYTKLEAGGIRVENECREGGLNGERRRIEGRAWAAGEGTEAAKLKVQFFWPFRGDYWIIELDEEYRWAVVGHPTRRYLWILSRTPAIAPQLYERIIAKIERQGYDPDDVQPTSQPATHGPPGVLHSPR